MEEMARRIAESTRIDGPMGLGPPDAYAAALAAIIETTEAAAKLVAKVPVTFRSLATYTDDVRADIADAIRAGQHYGKDTDQ